MSISVNGRYTQTINIGFFKERVIAIVSVKLVGEEERRKILMLTIHLTYR